MVTLRKSLLGGFSLGALLSLFLLSHPAQAVVMTAPAARGATRPQEVQAFLSGRVWSDMDQDGIQDEGELSVANVTINLLDGTGATLATRTSDAGGTYLFDNLGAGQFAVQFIAPAGVSFSPQDVGGNEAADSDVIPSTGITPVTTLGETDSIPHFDAGLLFPTSEESAPEPQTLPKLYLPIMRMD
jgi:hypothetical protein